MRALKYIFRSFYDRARVAPEFARETAGGATKFLALLVFLLTLAWVGPTLPSALSLNQIFRTEFAPIIDNFPTLQIADGEIVSPSGGEVRLLGASGKTIAIVKPGMTREELDLKTPEENIVVGKTFAYFSEEGEARIIDFEGYNGQVDSEFLWSWINSWVLILGLGAPALTFCILLLGCLAVAAICSLIIKVLGLLQGLRLTYSKLFKLSLLALPPGLVLGFFLLQVLPLPVAGALAGFFYIFLATAFLRAFVKGGDPKEAVISFGRSGKNTKPVKTAKARAAKKSR